MKKKHTRLSALLLAICLLLSMAVPAVWADEAVEGTVTYSFDYMGIPGLHQYSNGRVAYSGEQSKKLNKEGTTVLIDNNILLDNAYGKTINSRPMYHCKDNDGNPIFMAGGFSFSGLVGNWLAFKFQSPGAGMFNLTLTPSKSKAMPKGLDVYVLPADTAESAIIDGSALTKDALLGSENVNNTSEPVSIGNMEFEAGKDYLVVFKATKQSDYSSGATRADLKFVNMILTPGTGSGGASVDIPESLPFNPVVPEIAAENAIVAPVVSKMLTGTNKQNGHTNLYIFYQGGKMVVYDFTTKEKIDEEQGLDRQTRSAFVDSEGIVWSIGRDRLLFRYDPYTLSYTSQRTSFDGLADHKSFQGLGLTGGDDGNLYFGTYTQGCLIQYNPTTGKFTNLTGNGGLHPDVSYVGFGGLSVKDGFIYADIRGDANNDTIETRQIIKYDIANRKIVDSLDLSECFVDLDGSYVNDLQLAGDVLIGSSSKKLSKNIIIDISGDKMKLIDIEGLDYGLYAPCSEVVDGKVYFFGYLYDFANDRCIFEYDIATRKITKHLELGYITVPVAMGFPTGNLVTLDNDSALPGLSVLVYKNNADTGCVDIKLCNLQTKTIDENYINIYGGDGMQLRAITADPTGENIYLGAYLCNAIAQYNIASGSVVMQTPSHSSQTDSLTFYDGILYAGNYSTGSITRVDLETKVATPLFELSSTAFRQERMFAQASGDGKLFCGTIPCKARVGGVLVWYDLEKDRTYVAAGPNPEDVYYARTQYMQKPYTWYNAVTNEIVDFDDNDDGDDDYNIIVDGVEQQRFYGLIKNHSICKLVYQNGLVYGITTTNGGSETPYSGENAVIFVYDVAAMKVIATCDLNTAIEGLATPIPYIDGLAADPDVEGKFWGLVSDTLFSFTFDASTATFNVKEEFSMGKKKYYGGSTWHARDILFDGDYMYVTFPTAGVTAMLNKNNPKEYYVLYEGDALKWIALGADDNLYTIDGSSYNLMVLKIADQTAPIKDPSEAARAQALINALPDAASITLENAAAIAAARAAYDKLTDAGKAMVTDISKLTAAETAIAPLLAVAPVIEQIDAIGTVTLESKDAIEAARAAYDALTGDQKDLVTNYKTLTAAERALAALENPNALSPVVIGVLISLGVAALIAVAIIVIKKKRK